ncbi:nucleotidyltransferase domain-containing protein [uncultured Parabacteroides sp.]|uniref:nucleotidyltransferase domain-containing protein n=1 Tax=uncultured Parabacteroides sp. TaxID=512312 RepID=UPI0025FD3A12|nr:nucleotidyltransferase domain-containing protein [uncultured Parabacteroides sp.]
MEYGLSDETIKSLRNVFARYKQIGQVWLFGSRAKGNYHSGSDIDLAIKSEHFPVSRLLDIQIELDKLELLYKIDLILYDAIKEPALREHIDRVGKLFYPL